MDNYAVILAGGSGTRLWPLSRKNFPKQFLSLYGKRSLLEHTHARMARFAGAERVYYVTGAEHFYNVLNQAREVDPSFPEERIIVEPEGRNTFPAILLALRTLKECGANDDDAIVFTPADAYVGDEDAYQDTLVKASRSASRGMVVVGVEPTSPEIGYGYVKVGNAEGEAFRVERFAEKPDEATAKKYLASGGYLWNAGIYAGSLRVFLDEVRAQQPDAFTLYQKGAEEVRSHFASLPALSIDYALSEHAKRLFVVRGTFDWSDVGSFDALAKLLEERGEAYAKHVGVDSKGVFVHSEDDRLVVTLGVSDLVVVDHHDSLLIHQRGRSGEIGGVLKMLKEAGHKEVEHNILVHRPWGRYEVLLDTPNYKVKKITVYPGAKLSLQSHKHRAEHWVVVTGVARAVVGESAVEITQDQSAYIEAGTKHRLENPGNVNLEIIEVQTGSYLGEDDIVRYDDIYRRK